MRRWRPSTPGTRSMSSGIETRPRPVPDRSQLGARWSLSPQPNSKSSSFGFKSSSQNSRGGPAGLRHRRLLQQTATWLLCQRQKVFPRSSPSMVATWAINLLPWPLTHPRTTTVSPFPPWALTRWRRIRTGNLKGPATILIRLTARK
jgi:hypothetical protein